MSSTLMEYFNKQPRIGTLSTAGKDGRVDSACFGSPRMIDERTVVMAVRKARTLANLYENPNAVFTIIEAGKTPPEWKGIRVYLKMTDCQTAGERLEEMRKLAAQRVSAEAAKALHAAITLEVQEVRPLSDSGQGWEQST